MMLGGPPVLDPRTSFAVHTTDGTSYDVHTSRGVLRDAAFQVDQSALSDVVLLDFAAFDRWLEEEDEVVGHPRDPYHRIDVRPTSRHIEVRVGGQTLASSSRVNLLTETMLPPRFYIPREDVRLDLLTSSRTHTVCAYKGEASYFSVAGVTGGDDIAWTYEQPLHDAEPTAGNIAFFTERVDLLIDGELQERPVSPWS